MRRTALTILLILLSTATILQGQYVVGMGLKAGPALASQSYQFTPVDYTMDTKLIFGPGVAVFAEVQTGNSLSWQADLAFIGKGSKSSTESITVNHLENDRITENKGDPKTSNFYYLSLSPMARYRFDMDRLIPYGLLGPRLDYLLKYKTDSEYPLDDQNKLILGLTAGAGVEYKLDNLGIFFEIQFQPDLSPVTNKDPLLVNNNILLITLGIRYLSDR